MGHRSELSLRHIQVSRVPQLRVPGSESSDSTSAAEVHDGMDGLGKGSGLSTEAETENSSVLDRKAELWERGATEVNRVQGRWGYPQNTHLQKSGVRRCLEASD